MAVLLLVGAYSAIWAQTNLSPCASQAIHLVVLGSSTAAGSGPSSSDSAWVNRYRTYLKEINPLSQVTNLAIGGTNTYKIMPDWFVPPAGKPLTNSNNNISKAVSLMADAIIVNMPSNDAASGYTAPEQMTNFRIIKSVADSAGIPIWICTTQPRNFGTTQKQIQLATRDSILNAFGNFAVNFWQGFADSNDVILPIFDSGDGVHMNDTAHGILAGIMIAQGIPNYLADTISYTEHIVAFSLADEGIICGSSNTGIEVIVSNWGVTSNDSITVFLEIKDQYTGQRDTTVLPLGTYLSACSADTLVFYQNTSNGVNWKLRAFLSSNDSYKGNDTTAAVSLETMGYPIVVSLNDTVCRGDSTYLIASSNVSGDQIVWYDSLFGGNIVAYGDSLLIPVVQDSLTYYPQAVRGPLHFAQSLSNRQTTDVNYNGIMFNMISRDTIVIDSITVKINTAGNEALRAYYKNGTYLGYEANATAWTLWGVDTVSVPVGGGFVTFNLGGVQVNANDTLGIYLHMQSAASTLSYKRSNTPIISSNGQVSIPRGSGIAYTFGAVYYPRNFSGELYYHYGFNPEGTCSSSRSTVTLSTYKSELNLGNDTSILLGDQLQLNTPIGYSNIRWSNGDTSASILVDTSSFSAPSAVVWLVAIDENGCEVSDTIRVNFTTVVGLNQLEGSAFKLWPNPSTGIVHITGKHKKVIVTIKDLRGRMLARELLSDQIDLRAYDKGVYLLVLEHGAYVETRKVVLY
jgi:hypothetical protein